MLYVHNLGRGCISSQMCWITPSQETSGLEFRRTRTYLGKEEISDASGLLKRFMMYIYLWRTC